MPEPRNGDDSLLYPPFRQRLNAGLLDARKAGLAVYLFEGMRTPARQAELYAEGRTVPGRVVTNARPLESFHQYGLAADLVFGGPGLWTWTGDYEAVARIMEGHGLEWAGRWKRFPETPHFQFTAGLSTDTAKALYLSRGIAAVWDAVTRALNVTTTTTT